jgi:hypothetical protein
LNILTSEDRNPHFRKELLDGEISIFSLMIVKMKPAAQQCMPQIHKVFIDE